VLNLNASVALQVLPGVSEEKLFSVVDNVIHYIKSTGVNYEVGPFETTMEGDLHVLLEIVEKCQLICIEAGASYSYSNVKIIFNPKGVATINEKVQKHRE